VKVGDEFRPYKKFIGSMIPNNLMRSKIISDGAKLCYGRLCQFNGKNGSAFPSYETLGEELGVTRCTAKRRVKELVDNKLIKIYYNTGETNSYKFLWHEVFNDNDETEESIDSKGGAELHRGECRNDPPGGTEMTRGEYRNEPPGGADVYPKENHKENQIRESNKENNIRDSSPDDSYSIINFDNFSRSNIVFSHILLALEHNIKKLSGKDISLSEEEYSIMYSYRYKIIDYPDVEKLVELLDSKISNLYCSREEFHMEEVLSSILN